ncbi:MAG: L,D-transpeptidase, partial [Chloroflexota bacterium]
LPVSPSLTATPTLLPSATSVSTATEIPSTPTATPTPTSSSTSTPTATIYPSPTTQLTPGLRTLHVDQAEQQMYLFEDNRLIRTIPVSTGAPQIDRFTPAWQGEVGVSWGGGAIGTEGFYTDYIWYLFDGAEGSILIHSVPYTKEGNEKNYDRLDALGVEPTSHGCIRISPEDAAWLQGWNPVGASIEITPLPNLAEIFNPTDNLLTPNLEKELAWEEKEKAQE